MNEYIFYTAEGETIPPLRDKEVDNCQLLGRTYGVNANAAEASLIEENPWIREAGFDIQKAFREQLFTTQQREDLKALLLYIHKKDQENSPLNLNNDKAIKETMRRLKMACNG